MEGAAVSQIAGRNGVPCVILRAMSDNADESGYEVLVVKKLSLIHIFEEAAAQLKELGYTRVLVLGKGGFAPCEL